MLHRDNPKRRAADLAESEARVKSIYKEEKGIKVLTLKNNVFIYLCSIVAFFVAAYYLFGANSVLDTAKTTVGKLNQKSVDKSSAYYRVNEVVIRFDKYHESIPLTTPRSLVFTGCEPDIQREDNTCKLVFEEFK